MEFKIQPGIIIVSDNVSGKYPTLFAPGGHKCRFRDDGSSFNDAEQVYRWVFEYNTPVVESDVFVFAAAGRTQTGVANANGEMQVVDRPIDVARSWDGAPLFIQGTPRPKITIMIVTMNRREILEKTLWYLYETTTDEERDLFIWDNASTDDTPDFLGTLVGWPGVRVFRSKEDLGVAGPRERMMAEVKTPFIFTLDDDVWMMSRGWASAASRVLEADVSIHQLIVQQCYVHSTNNFGSAHGILGKPFFRVPVMLPQDPGQEPDLAQRGWIAPETDVVQVGGETVLVPVGKTQLPFAVSGGAAAWRVSDLLPLLHRPKRHLVCDLREVWGFPLQAERGTREAMIFRYGAFHPCPGGLWHLGHGEGYWAERCRHSEAIYNRSAEMQRKWLEDTRAWSGWGRPLEDPDVVLK